jgi:stage III sporulation protein AG
MLKELFKKREEQTDQKKKIENIVAFIIILIITVLIINNMWSKDEKKNTNTTGKVLAGNVESQVSTSENIDDLEMRLENILETINGVGKVKVLLKYSESSQVVAMYNETNSENKTEENDGDGGTKNSTETETKREIVYTDENGTNKPITEKVIMPVIEGAIITAQGASNANIKSSIVSAVEAVTGLAIHKIQVFEMKN